MYLLVESDHWKTELLFGYMNLFLIHQMSSLSEEEAHDDHRSDLNTNGPIGSYIEFFISSWWTA